MGFNKRKMEDARKTEADKEAASRRELGPQILEDAGRLIADWRQAKRGPVLFSPTIGAAVAAQRWFLWVQCPAQTPSTCARCAVTPTRRSQASSGAVLAIMPTECPLC